MRVLVTGAAGFLGGHLCRILAASGHEVRVLLRPGRAAPHLARPGVEFAVGDLQDEPGLRRACRGCDGVVHAAARQGYWSRRNAEQWRDNVEGTAALLRSAGTARVGRIVHVSSIATVGATRNGVVLDESAAWSGPSPNHIHYLKTKRESEERALAAAWAGLPVVVVNPCMLIGPHAADGRPSSTIAAVAAGARRWAPPGGVSVADVEDVAWGVASALERGRVGERYILGGENVAWSELLTRIARVVGVPPPAWTMPRSLARVLAAGTSALDLLRLSRPPWTPEVFRAYGWTLFVDSAKARAELGYSFRSIEECVRRTLGGRMHAPGPDPIAGSQRE